MNNKEKYFLTKVAEHPLVDGLPDSDGDGLPDGFDDSGSTVPFGDDPDFPYPSESRMNKPWLAGSPELAYESGTPEGLKGIPWDQVQQAAQEEANAGGGIPLTNAFLEELAAQEGRGGLDLTGRHTDLSDEITRNYVVDNEVPETVTDPNAPDAGTIVPGSFVSGNEPTVTNSELGNTPSQLPDEKPDEESPWWKWPAILGGGGLAAYGASHLMDDEKDEKKKKKKKKKD